MRELAVHIPRESILMAKRSQTEIRELQRLWCKGLSCAKIAKRLEWVSKNAVIGEIDRQRARDPDGWPVRQPARRPRSTPLAPAVTLPAPIFPDGTPLWQQLIELPADCCRWPVLGGFCGKRTPLMQAHGGRTWRSSWCSEHREKAFEKQSGCREIA